MAIFDIFSKRQKRLRGEVPDVYIYDNIPDELRIQIVHIWNSSLGNENEYDNEKLQVQLAYKKIVDILCREYGRFHLHDSHYGIYDEREYRKELHNFILNEKDTERVLDAIELSFDVLDQCGRKYEYKHIMDADASKNIDAAIAELNSRFKEHGIGFQFEGRKIIRVDSQLLHTEAVKPALSLLSTKEYAGAQEEFLNAYDHFRHGNHKEALNEALKSFESTMKVICGKRSWSYSSKDTSNKLIEICCQNNLIPVFWQSQMGALRSLLEGGVSTGRNNLSGHGQGATPKTVPDHIVSFVLHMSAAAIIFLIKSEQSLK